uniref:LRRCT domain-containing protein n=1 Tax=Dendroctonus ponderosae TaxID=77166 RepID=A0AAR5PKM9_DENPD
MDLKWAILCVLTLGAALLEGSKGQKTCPMPKSILPCRCLIRGEEFQIWCTHSDLPSVVDGLRATAKFIQEPIDELILENNLLPALPGRSFVHLKILRLMLRHNGLERVSNDWLGGLETTLMELFIVEPKLRTMPEDSLAQLIALQAVTIETNEMKRLPMFSGLPKLRYLQIQSSSLLELSPRNFKNNPSLEKIHIGQSPQLNRLEAEVFRDLPSLSLLNISNCGLTWMHHRAITRLPILEELVLVGNRIKDAGMVGRASRELPQLATLRLDNNHIDVLGEAGFVDLPTLRSLHLPNNRITELHHGAFHRVPQLRELNLNGNFLRRVHPESFLQESGSGLEELWLVRNEIGHVADLRAILDALPRLTFLDMSHNQLEAIPFGSLRGHPTLEHFNLDHNRIHLIDREAFVAMPALRELRLKNNSLSNHLHQYPFWNLPELKGLDLSDNFFRKLEPNFLQDLPSLRKLDLSGNELSFIDPAAFALTPSLENLNISFNAVSALHPATFRPLLGLYELDVSSNILGEFLPGLPRGIEYLHLKNNAITQLPSAPSLDLQLPALRALDLSGNKIHTLPIEGFSALAQLRKLLLGKNLLKKLEDGNFKGLARLETLDLAQNGIARLMPNAFRQQTELRELNLGDNRLELLMQETLHFSPHLKRLNLSRNMLSEILPGTIEKNRDLQIIDFSYNKIVRLPPTLMGLKHLRMLDLTYNRLSAIDPEILGSLPSLRMLRLSHNFIKELKEDGFNKLQHLAGLDLEENELEIIQPNAIKSLPVLKTINLSRNKIREVPNVAFVNLPALQVVELQQNRIRSIAPSAFMGVPHLLMLNLSSNDISTFEDAGLRGAKSLELLDVSHNVIKSVSSNSLEKMEWLVELRIDSNQICGVQGSPFNNMPRLRVLSMRDNQMMSFPERAIERVRRNIALLDIEGNPLACSCNMVWLQAWLQERTAKGPRCVDGYLLSDLHMLRANCPEEERNIELVAPGCEAELLSAPGVYGTAQVLSQWMNLKAINGSENALALAPERSDYFDYDDFVDYPYNETAVQLQEITNSSEKALSSPDVTAGDTPTLYASQKNKLIEVPKTVTNSPSSSGFTFFGVPLPNIGKLLSGAVKNRGGMKAESIRMDDRVAIVNKPTKTPPTFPKFEIGNSTICDCCSDSNAISGGFVPMIPGELGGFKPISNPLGELSTKSSIENDASTIELSVAATGKPPQRTPSTVPTLEPAPLPDSSENTKKNSFGHPPPSSTEAIATSSTQRQESTTVATTESLPETTQSSEESTTILKIESTTILEAPKPAKQIEEVKSIPQTSFLVPGGQSPKKMATITKIPSSSLPSSASAPLRSEDTLPPMAHNREPKKMLPIVQTERAPNEDLNWYFATYNNSNVGFSHAVARPALPGSALYIFIPWVLVNYAFLL